MPLPIPGRTVEALRRSTAFISNGSRRRSGTGSAVVLSDDQVVTNAHVITGGELSVESWEGIMVAGRVLRIDRARDLALVKAEGFGAPAASLFDSEPIRAGTPVLAVGNPLGFRGAVSTGTVHAPNAPGAPLRWIYADVRLAPGNSGGPLADLTGRVIGINTMMTSHGLALAVPARIVQAFLSGRTRRSLGVTLRAVQQASQGFGLLVLEVSPKGAAAHASLLPGDVLIGANRAGLKHVEDLETALDTWTGPVLTIQFVRGGSGKEREVTLSFPEGGIPAAA